jgi:hypothetical protein
MNNHTIIINVLYRKNATLTYEQFYKIAVRLLYTKVETLRNLSNIMVVLVHGTGHAAGYGNCIEHGRGGE